LIRADDLDVEYVVAGSGQPLIALHGAAGSGADHFATLLPVLADGCRVYAPDARGHGGTRWDPRAGFRTDVLAADVLAFADAIGLDTFHLLGYSMGAMTALHVAADHGERLRTLVLVSITVEREPRLSAGRRLLDPERIIRDDPVWAQQLAARHDRVQGTGAWRRLLPAITEDVARQPLLDAARVRSIDAPTLVAVGDRDPLVPVTHAQALARQVQAGRLFVLPDVGHDAIAARPTILHAALVDFYRSTESIARDRAGASIGMEVSR
jgi:pimeloyl-ACP methyl ester carboxylesterase